jgi:hypothetical protein
VLAIKRVRQSPHTLDRCARGGRWRGAGKPPARCREISMGWYSTRGATKEDVVQELLQDTSPIDHELCGSVLWAVVEFADRRVIGCFLLGACSDGWGYKPMDEGMHPYYYDCPLRLLELAPVACEEWRAKVRAHHAGRSC